MPKLKKIFPDKTDFEILSALYYLKTATATDLEKEIKLSRATISDRLKWLAEKGYLGEPHVSISTTYRLKKLYVVPSKNILTLLLLILYATQQCNKVRQQYTETRYSLHSRVDLHAEYYCSILDLLSKYLSKCLPYELYKLLENGCSACIDYRDAKKIIRAVYDLRYELIGEKIRDLGSKSVKDIEKLIVGVGLREAKEIFGKYSELFTYEFLELVEVVECPQMVRLTEEGISHIIKYWVKDVKEKLIAIKNISLSDYENVLSEICKNKNK